MALPIIDPVKPRLSRELPTGPEWRFEVKLDGFRGVLYIEAGRAGERVIR